MAEQFYDIVIPPPPAIIDDLNSTSNNSVLSARQGKVLDDKIRQLNNQIELLKKSSMGADEMRVDYFLEPGTHQWHCPADCEEVVLTMAAGGHSFSNSTNLQYATFNEFNMIHGGYIFKKRIQIPQNLRNTDIPIQVGKAFNIDFSMFSNVMPNPSGSVFITINNNSQIKKYYLIPEVVNPTHLTYNGITFNIDRIRQYLPKLNSSFGNLATCTGGYKLGDIIEGVPFGKHYSITYYVTHSNVSAKYFYYSRLMSNCYTPLASWNHNGISIPVYCGCGAVGFFSGNIPSNAIIPSKLSASFRIEETHINLSQSIPNGAGGSTVYSPSGNISAFTLFAAQPGCVIVEYK